MKTNPLSCKAQVDKINCATVHRNELMEKVFVFPKRSKMKKGQVAIEFMALVGVAVLLLLLFTGVVAYYLKITTQQQNAYSGQGLAMTIRQEINTASIVENNYERKIKIPGQLDGKNYRLAITGREVTITYAGNDYSELLAIDTGVGITADENVVKRD